MLVKSCQMKHNNNQLQRHSNKAPEMQENKCFQRKMGFGPSENHRNKVKLIKSHIDNQLQCCSLCSSNQKPFTSLQRTVNKIQSTILSEAEYLFWSFKPTVAQHLIIAKLFWQNIPQKILSLSHVDFTVIDNLQLF